MRIYTRCVIDMTTGQVDDARSESFEYDGPVAECKGGGGGSQGAPNFYYEQLVASGEAETEMTQQLFDYYKYGTFGDPADQIKATGSASKTLADLDVVDFSGNTIVAAVDPEVRGIQQTIASNLQNSGFGTNLASAVLGGGVGYKMPDGTIVYGEKEAQAALDKWNKTNAQAWVTQDGKTFDSEAKALAYVNQNRPTSYADMESAQINANMQLIPLQTQAAMKLIPLQTQAAEQELQTSLLAQKEQRNIIKARAPLLKDFFTEAGNVDENEWANRAAAGVAQQYGDAATILNQNLRRTGTRVGSDREAALRADLAFARSRDVAGAANNARVAAGHEKFNRLYQAVGGGTA